MPYPVATWDEEAMGRPQAQGLTFSESSVLMRSNEVSAEPLYTKVATKRPQRLDVEFQMSLTQWAFFREFFEQTLRHGMAWFSMVVYVGAPASRVVHIDTYEVSWLADDLAALKMTIEVAR